VVVTVHTVDVSFCEAMAARILQGDGNAGRLLVEHIWPAWLEMVRTSRSMGPLARSEDDVHNVVARLVEKIGHPDGRALRLYPPWRDRHLGKTFEDWLRIVTTNVIRDYVRERAGPRTGADRSIGVKRLLNDFAASGALDRHGVRPPFTAAETARQMLAYARTHLPEVQLGALRHWLEGASFAEMGDTLGVSAEEAQRTLRAAVAVLRRHFCDEPSPGGA
jgi:DNA-directed RNA polymerase specialized sigma24 family protein